MLTPLKKIHYEAADALAGIRTWENDFIVTCNLELEMYRGLPTIQAMLCSFIAHETHRVERSLLPCCTYHVAVNPMHERHELLVTAAPPE